MSSSTSGDEEYNSRKRQAGNTPSDQEYGGVVGRGKYQENAGDRLSQGTRQRFRREVPRESGAHRLLVRVFRDEGIHGGIAHRGGDTVNAADGEKLPGGRGESQEERHETAQGESGNEAPLDTLFTLN